MRTVMEIATPTFSPDQKRWPYYAMLWTRLMFWRAVEVPEPYQAGEPEAIYVRRRIGGWLNERWALQEFCPYTLPSPHYAPAVVTGNIERTRP